MDVDGEQDEDEDVQNGVVDLNDIEVMKVKVEKMQFGVVKDVWSVVSFMQIFELVFEVSDFFLFCYLVYVG